MQKPLVLLVMVAGLALLATSCAGPEKKFGRGVANVTEIARWGECRRSIEQTAVFYSPEQGYSWGLVSGVNKTLARTGLGVFEILTFPIPTYDPIWTNYLSPNPEFPASYRPNLVSGPTFDTDTSLGFTGGDIIPIVPGSRFHIYEQPH